MRSGRLLRSESVLKKAIPGEPFLGGGARRNDFQKADDQGENSFAKSRVARDWTPFQKTPICCGAEMSQ